MDGRNREGYAGGNMTTGSVRESADTGRRIASGGTNTTWRVHDGNGGSLPSSVLGLRYLFQGREYSWAVHAATGGTGLYNFRARWYDPATGRWLSNDPIGISGGLNQYAFCANNPVMFVDPYGLFTDYGRTTSVDLVSVRVGFGPAALLSVAAVYDTQGGWGVKMTVGVGAGVEAALSVGKGLLNKLWNTIQGKTVSTSEGNITWLRGFGQEGHVGLGIGRSFDPSASGSCVLTGWEVGGVGGGVYWTWSLVIDIAELFPGEGSLDPQRLQYMPAFGWRPY